ncbi:Na+/H+ antiporter NhaA [Anaerovorax odorimutans]|uniref:Na(+)/H(+) antiporter NhaA n=1 Tax=Anaerovorax odorimutans TaxID=109327 RepID=A0ABT1RJZ3_9FIRM|nr:Na+/H+ antiporter NhaA [Anaerovorax odorimutans]MCQ4635506.1 Na+/H+ antiporter NhaA [Anaerovorax odorimutans]
MLKNLNRICREFSIPLILGVVCAMAGANLFPNMYHHVIHAPFFGETISLHWLVNDIFMVFFFAIAGVEIVNSLSKGGSLNPLKKAVAPLMATAGGVIFPAAVFLIINWVAGDSSYTNGWGICTATDIALAWLVARLIFGTLHPAVNFLLLLAVADDAVGLAIIAVFYPEPGSTVQPVWLLLVLAAMILAWGLRKLRVRYFEPYILLCGSVSWMGMYHAGVHPALALVFIIPFLPRTGKSIPQNDEHGPDHTYGKSALHTFEHRIGAAVDYGLFFFGFTNAGVELGSLSSLSLIIFLAFLIGKSGGVLLFSWLAVKFKASLPEGMNFKDVAAVGFISGIGLTVALFVSENAFTDSRLTDAAKMGALLSLLTAVPATIAARIFKIGRWAAEPVLRGPCKGSVPNPNT